MIEHAIRNRAPREHGQEAQDARRPRGTVARPNAQLAKAPAADSRAREHADPLPQRAGAMSLHGISTLAGGVAQDLNNVVTPILLSVARLDRQLTDPESRRLLSMLHEAAQRGASMVSQLLTFARDIDQPRRGTDPRRLLEAIRRLLAESFPRSVDLDVEVAAGVADIASDCTDLYPVLVNVCTEACETMASGGRLTLRAETTVVDEDTAAQLPGGRGGIFVMLTITDTAAQPASDVRCEALSVGGGFMTRQREHARGSVCRVYLPALTDPDPPQTDAATWPGGNGEVVMIVDDEASVRWMAAEVLTAYGYCVLPVATGAEAVAEFAKHAGGVRAVLADALLPSSNGTNTIRALQMIDPTVKLIAMTSMASDASVLDSLPPGAALLPKPFAAERLLRALRHVLDA
jgi:two-component system, cell cycle sensor histidine kinase and response regulator CckA